MEKSALATSLYQEWSGVMQYGIGAIIRREPGVVRDADNPHGRWEVQNDLQGSQGDVTMTVSIRVVGDALFAISLNGTLHVDQSQVWEADDAVQALGQELPGVINSSKEQDGRLEIIYNHRPKLSAEKRLYAYWAVLAEWAITQFRRDSLVFGKPTIDGVTLPYHIDLGHQVVTGQLQLLSRDLRDREPSRDFTLFFTVQGYPALDAKLARARFKEHFLVFGFSLIEDGVELHIEV